MTTDEGTEVVESWFVRFTVSPYANYPRYDFTALHFQAAPGVFGAIAPPIIEIVAACDHGEDICADDIIQLERRSYGDHGNISVGNQRGHNLAIGFRATAWAGQVMAAAHDLPAHVDPRYSRQTGADILRRGLPELPGSLSYDMALPAAYWRAENSGAVLFLSFDVAGGLAIPMATMGAYRREPNGWAARAAWAMVGWSDDPVREEGSYDGFEGSSIVVGGTNISMDTAPGYPGLIAIGQAAKDVAAIAVTQGDSETRQRLDSYFGAWIICCDKAAPYSITAFDAQGNILGYIDEGW